MILDIDEVIIHCSATTTDMDIGVAEIDIWHKIRGWDGIGYHFVIRRSGEIENGRSESLGGAHTFGHNAKSIAICLVGGLDDEAVPEVNYTRYQWRSLDSLVEQIIEERGWLKVSGHRDYSSKFCPGFPSEEWWGSRS